MPVELDVVLVADLVLGPCPQRGGLVDGIVSGRLTRIVPALFRRHEDRQADVIGVLADDRAQPVAVEQILLTVPEVEHDRGAPGRSLRRLQRVLAPPVRGPPDALVRGQAGPAGSQLHLVRHDEGGVEAHAELADEGGVLALVAGQRLEELAGARLGDGADVLDHFRAAHADAVIGDRDRSRVLVV